MSESSFTFRINTEILDNFKTSAKNNNRLASQLVRDFMILYMSDKGVLWASKVLRSFSDEAEKDLSGKFGIRVDKDLVAGFKNKAQENQHTPSKVIRSAIQDYLTKIA